MTRITLAIAVAALFAGCAQTTTITCSRGEEKKLPMRKNSAFVYRNGCKVAVTYRGDVSMEQAREAQQLLEDVTREPLSGGAR